MRRVSLLLYSIGFLTIGYLLNSQYRPFVYKHEISDLGLADIGNNIIFIPCAYFIILFFRRKPFYGIYADLIFYFTFLVSIEILSFLFQIFGIFDAKDILGLAIGGMITFTLIKINKLDTQNFEMH